MKSENQPERKVAYPKIGDTVQITVGREQGVEYVGIYEMIDGKGTDKITLEFKDVRVVKKSDIPI